MNPALAIEASGPRAAVAVFDAGAGGAVVAARARPSAFEHARVLAALAAEVLDEAKVAARDLAGVAVDVGPGSFTALRVALATAHGLVQPFARPVVGVTAFAALADGVAEPRRVIVPLVPAGRALLYAGFLRSDARAVRTILRGPAVGDFATIGTAVDEALALCPRGYAPLFVGPGAARERTALEARWPGATGDAATVLAEDGPDVAAIARLGAALLAPPPAPSPAAAAVEPPRPLYVRAPQAVERLPAERAAWADLTLAPLAESDLEEVLEVERTVFSDPWPRSFFLDEMAHPRALAVVVRSRGILAGYLLAWRLESEMHLGNLAVAPGFQRRGIGRYLLEWLVAQADSGGQRHITLEVRASNFAAQELYRRYGFRAIALRRGYYQDTGEDALVMMRDGAGDPAPTGP